jgi:cytochrome c oxidase subunit 4
LPIRSKNTWAINTRSNALENKSGHHIIPLKVYLTAGGSLLFLTLVTIGASYIDLGFLNIVVALAIATSKAIIVAFFFMHLYYDNKIYFFVFSLSIFFLSILISLTMLDTLRRGDIYSYRQNPITDKAAFYTNEMPEAGSAVMSGDLLAGKKLFENSCMGCHSIIGQNGLSAPLSGLDEEFIYEYIDRLEYTRWIMTPFFGTESERRMLAGYLYDQTDKAVVLKTGKEIFEKRCGYCHTVDGDIQPIYDSFYGSTYEDVIDLIEFLPDQIWFMVPWLGTDEELQLLAEYIMSWYDNVNSN